MILNWEHTRVFQIDILFISKTAPWTCIKLVALHRSLPTYLFFTWLLKFPRFYFSPSFIASCFCLFINTFVSIFSLHLTPKELVYRELCEIRMALNYWIISFLFFWGTIIISWLNFLKWRLLIFHLILYRCKRCFSTISIFFSKMFEFNIIEKWKLICSSRMEDLTH